jgi:outer membrane scaffolding protein for murein synthesis (MipA/OmpV family)
MRVRRSLFALLFMLPLASVRAQDPGGASVVTGQVGMLVLALPRYPGSDQRWVVPVPFVDLRVARRLYVGDGMAGLSAGAGVFLVERGGVFWTADLALTADRPEDRTAALAGMGDRGFGAFGGTTLGYRTGPLEATAAVGLGLERDMGLMGALGLSLGGPLGGRWFGQLGTNAVFGDCANLRWDYGVDREQASRRGALLAAGAPGLAPGDDVPFTPRCGLRELRANGVIGYALSSRVSLLGTGSGVRLERGAAESPLTRERNGWEAGLGLAWRF